MKDEGLTSKQVNPPNPTGKGGFGDNPQNRSDGRWNKENSFSYWMNYFKAMTVQDFKKYETEKSDEVRTVAESLAYSRVAGARADLKEFQEVADRTEGRPKQSIGFDGQIRLEQPILGGLSVPDSNSDSQDSQS